MGQSTFTCHVNVVLFYLQVLQTCHLTLVIKSVPQLWHKGVGKANQVIDRREKRRKKRRREGRIRAQVVAETRGGIGAAVLVI